MTISGFFSSELKSVGEAAEPARAVVFVQGLHKWYGMFESLRGVDLEVTRGEVVVILGPDGAGKTTLMEILGGVRTPSSGVVKVFGEDPSCAGEAWHARTGTVLQMWRENSGWRVRDLLEYCAARYALIRTPGCPQPRPVGDVLELVRMTGSAVKRLGALHDGQRQRFDIAFSLITRPEILLLDEPTKDLGPAARGEFHEVIRYLAIGEGMTIILTTRDLAEAQRIGDRVAVLMQGRLVTQCAPAEAWRRYPGTPCDFRDLLGHNWKEQPRWRS